MTSFICINCGTQFSPSNSPPAHCLICEDEREFVGINGQQWTSREEMISSNKYKNKIIEEEPGIYSILLEPSFGIGQRALLVQTPNGNILWDCVSYLDQQTIQYIKEKFGDLSAIAISHPHYYTTMIEWSREFGNIPIYIHQLDKQWVMRPDKCIEFWNGDTLDLLNGELKLVCTGGHFKGFQVLYWPRRQILFSGDQPQICMDPKQVSFMYSYPNFIPLNARKINHIMKCLQPLDFDRLYGAFKNRGLKGVIETKAKEIVEKSVKRYLKAISDDNDD
ncbi:unnamed protein product [Didymodactylos carnosus]|uniref:Metallo-beta-lactamase domain-containing protein n=1 Tax=Didymodactylos carnosus TaxID=1234261 RepID=A0A814PRV4_9BILA|nr:unnamed protein product [Didymodactylos carnosus]CAF1109592.1 unnamed protein product [Didymodactylos carnosus]CAF3666659.1 unnamed protein product [Didymodactylos carnosus]CAF3874013.1 unnamed protein product [Didymodactylos carnosus]